MKNIHKSLLKFSTVLFMLSAANSSYAMDAAAAGPAAREPMSQEEFDRFVRQVSIAMRAEIARNAAENPMAALFGANNIGASIGNSIANGLTNPAAIERGINAVAIATHRIFQENGQGAAAIRSVVGSVLRESGPLIGESFSSGGAMRNGCSQVAWMAVDHASRFALLGAAFTSFYFTAKYGGKVLFDYIDRNLRTPQLALESSKKNKNTKSEPIEVVYADTQEEVKQLIPSIKLTNNLIQNGNTIITHQPLIFWGPPGTGKSLNATKIAKETGMDFVILTAASLFQFKEKASNELDKLWAWGTKSKKGLIVLIEEIDALVANRDKLGEVNEKTLLHLLQLLGTRNQKILAIGTTNRRENLDVAIYRRFDKFIEMGLPDIAMRKKLLVHYIQKLFLNTNPKNNNASFVTYAKTVFTDQLITELAQKTDGCTNSSMHALINDLYTKAKSTQTINKKMIDQSIFYTQEQEKLSREQVSKIKSDTAATKP